MLIYVNVYFVYKYVITYNMVTADTTSVFVCVTFLVPFISQCYTCLLCSE